MEIRKSWKVSEVEKYDKLFNPQATRATNSSLDIVYISDITLQNIYLW